ncbi:hypothetical protein KGF57_001790 [Candida theae]|uniref:Uncharacterized protein n=1 Tax=Candida theae TaxID=1198502 RepID=A0AAD5FZL3_9ASCO|nr:uncharacterized protein KGF57_001790 [Candida theae]KAI5961277.1 hypothetical protein KGF57_001790 [Candida theae]
MGSSEDDEALKILASIRIKKSIDDLQLQYLSQGGETGYSERVIRDVLSIVFELDRRAVPDTVKLLLIKRCFIPSCEVPIQVLLNIFGNLGSTQYRIHRTKDVPPKKISIALQVELLNRITEKFESFSPAFQAYSSILLPMLTKLMSYEVLRFHISSILRLVMFQNLPQYMCCRNMHRRKETFALRNWEHNWIKDLHIKFPEDPNLRMLVDVLGTVIVSDPITLEPNTSIFTSDWRDSWIQNPSDDKFKRQKTGLTSVFDRRGIIKDEMDSIKASNVEQDTRRKNMLAIQLCTNKVTVAEADEYLKIVSFQSRAFHKDWIITALWHFRRFKNDNLSLEHINKLLLKSDSGSEWREMLCQRVAFMPLLNASGGELRSMIMNDKKKLSEYYPQNVLLYSSLCEKYIIGLLRSIEVNVMHNFKLLNEIAPMLFELTQFCPKARATVARIILSLYRRGRVADGSHTAIFTLPRSIVYFMLLQGDLNLLDEVCLHIAEEKSFRYEDDKSRRMQNSFTMEIVNLIWRGRFLSLDSRRDSPHKAFFFNPSLVPKVLNSNLASIGLRDIGGILMSPVFAFIAATRLRYLEDKYNLEVRLEGPPTEESIVLMQTNTHVQWLQLSRDAIKLEVLRYLDEKHFNGICDMMFKSLKSLSKARGVTNIITQ